MTFFESLAGLLIISRGEYYEEEVFKISHSNKWSYLVLSLHVLESFKSFSGHYYIFIFLIAFVRISGDCIFNLKKI